MASAVAMVLGDDATVSRGSPQPGDGHHRAQARLQAKLRENATTYAGVSQAPATRQVLRRRALKATKAERAASRKEAIRSRRKKAVA
ncbi:MAG: hypothetical protein JWQ97_964 [Phenylobacterium sp.]|nr:hypothetical protein [Phenylobacterium sp.]